jgi:hypothetical protein
MSKPSTTSIACGACGVEAPFVAWESLNATLDPDEKDALLRGDLTRFTCRQCGWSGPVVHPLLYHDMERQFMVWLIPSADPEHSADRRFPEPMPGYRFRRVTNLNELKEKIYLFDEGLDDRQMEVLKLIVELRSAQTEDRITGPLFYSEQVVEEGGEPVMRFAHLAADGVKTLSVNARALTDVAGAVKELLPADGGTEGDWLVVDRAYALKIMQSVGKRANPPGAPASDSDQTDQ